MREYGWSIEYVEALPIDVANKAFRAASILSARDRLHEINIAAYPTMKDDGRKKYFNSINKASKPFIEEKVLSARELGAQLRDLYGGSRN